MHKTEEKRFTRPEKGARPLVLKQCGNQGTQELITLHSGSKPLQQN